MPRFMTISPTHVAGKKEYAWKKFLSGPYIALGWIEQHDLTGKSLNEVISLIRKENYDNEASAIDAFTKFLTLQNGDYVAVNNTASGLFGVGTISSGYKYEKYKHDTGAEDKEEFYPHFREVDWKHTSYVRREDIVGPEETAWKPYGTVGNLENEVPVYIKRLLGEKPAAQGPKKANVVPNYLREVVKSIQQLKSDPTIKKEAMSLSLRIFFPHLVIKSTRT